MTKNLLTIALLFVYSIMAIAQNEENQQVDPSKPTNIYDRVNNNLEFTDRSGKQEFGYRFNYSYANELGIQATLEVPFLYSVDNNNFGVSDLRLRAFYVPYTDYDKLFGGLGVSMDIFIPTGDINKGLGSGSWSVSPGVIMGLMLSDSYSLWPIVSYRYQIGASQEVNVIKHGGSLQLLNSVSFSDRIYLLASPMFIINDFQNDFEDLVGGEVELNYMIIPNKLQIGTFTRHLANKGVHTQSYRLFARFFL
ncbi:transporter [Tamlana fucoidanivorans]|uniref:Transporter n=1 Tax=Allotamlana fucoidanivorans TaxID=2583814 RepID=A0A5C4SDU1_9FLAO|nr:transporter [Tamlana fucoidanivorans]TNJ41697.1 transporter [Tamlana fucoidanivorans]